jgi:hypothetical protein
MIDPNGHEIVGWPEASLIGGRRSGESVAAPERGVQIRSTAIVRPFRWGAIAECGMKLRASAHATLAVRTSALRRYYLPCLGVALGVSAGGVRPLAPGLAVGDAWTEPAWPVRRAESAGSCAGTGKSGQRWPWAACM